VSLELSAVLPYPELSEEHGRVLEMLWSFHEEHGRWPREDDEACYYAKCDLEVVRRLATLKLVTTARAESGPDLRRPTAFGLAYVSATEARSLLQDIDVLMRYTASRFHPDVHEVTFDEITQVTGLEEARLLELVPFADDLQLHIRQQAVGSWDHWSLFEDGVAGAFARARIADQRRQPVSDFSASALPIRLRSLELEHFRALSRLELDLTSPLTVLVGPNGVGKSTTLDALGFLSMAARGGLAAALAGELGLSRLRERGNPAPMILRLGFELDAGFGFRAGEYLVELDDPRGVVAVTREELVYQGQDEAITWLRSSRAMTRLRDSEGEMEERYHAIDALGLEGVRDASRYPIVMALRHALASMALVDRDPIFDEGQTFSEPNGIEQQPSRRGYRRRGASASPRELLHRSVPDRESAKRLGEVLSKLVPSVRRVERRVVTGGLAELDVYEQGSDVPARVDELSQGTRQMLLLAALYVDPDPPTILLLEEPDAGLHPAVLQPLVDLLREMSRRSSILATTHSPYLVAMLDREREVVALQRHAERVTAEPLAQALSSSRWLAAMDPAEAFFRRGLESAP